MASAMHEHGPRHRAVRHLHNATAIHADRTNKGAEALKRYAEQETERKAAAKQSAAPTQETTPNV